MTDDAPKMVTRFDALGRWDDGMLAHDFGKPMTAALFRDDEIVVDWPYDHETTHIVLKRTTGSHYKGETTWAVGTRSEVKGVVEAELYSNDGGHVLMGEERWPNGEVDWFVLRLTNGRPVT